MLVPLQQHVCRRERDAEGKELEGDFKADTMSYLETGELTKSRIREQMYKPQFQKKNIVGILPKSAVKKIKSPLWYLDKMSNFTDCKSFNIYSYNTL